MQVHGIGNIRGGKEVVVAGSGGVFPLLHDSKKHWVVP